MAISWEETAHTSHGITEVAGLTGTAKCACSSETPEICKRCEKASHGTSLTGLRVEEQCNWFLDALALLLRGEFKYLAV